MGASDIIWMVLIIAAAGYLLYHSVWNKKGHCTGCDGCSCPSAAQMKTGSIQIRDRKKKILIASAFALLLGAQTASAGHPLITDDAGTVGAGSLQIELNAAISSDRSREDGITLKERSTEVSMTATVGLHERVDLVFGLPCQMISSYENGERISRSDGLSDVSLDLKYRFFEQDGWSFAVKPGLSLPTGDDDRGLGNGRAAYSLFLITTRELAPWAFHLNIGYIRNENRSGYRKNLWHASAAAEVEVMKDLKAVFNTGIESNPDALGTSQPVFALAGLIYQISDAYSIDAGVKAGLTKAEADIAYLVGVTMKF